MRICGWLITCALLATCGAYCSAAAIQSNEISAIQDLIAKGDVENADIRLQKALRSAPRDGGLYNLRGILEAQRGRLDQAEADFQEASRLSPGLVSAYLNLGHLYKLEIDRSPLYLDRAISVYERALKHDAHSNEAHLELATLLEWRGSFSASLHHVVELSVPVQNQARALALRCANLSALGRKIEAETAGKAMLAAKDFKAEDLAGIMPVLRDKADWRLLEIVIGWSREHGGATDEDTALLARAYEQDRRFPEARQALEQLARKQPQAIYALVDLARVAYKQGEKEAALGYLAHARDLEPQNATIHFVFGIIALELKLPLEAQDSVTKALALDPGNPDFNFGMGVVKLHGHDTLESVPFFQKFLSVQPDNPRGHYGLGTAYYFGGKYDLARQELTSAVRSPLTSEGAHFFLGKIAKVMGDDRTAAAEFRAALQKDPANADAHAELASLLIRSSQFERASAEIESALRLDPDNLAANTALLVLYQRTKDGRSSEQRGKVQALEHKRDEQQELLYRRIEVRPY